MTVAHEEKYLHKANMSYSPAIISARRHIESKGLYLMQKKDVERFTECAVQSYGSIEYPLNDYFMGRACTKDDLHAMWLFNLKYFLGNALIYADSPECNGWMLWIEPGCKGVSPLQFLLHGGIGMTAQLGFGTLRRVMAYENYSKSVRLNTTGGKEWYLYNLVVDPKAQGKHVASKLILPMLEYCSMQGKTVYLETHREMNTAIYEHFGFRIASNGLMPGTQLRHFGMVKE